LHRERERARARGLGLAQGERARAREKNIHTYILSLYIYIYISHPHAHPHTHTHAHRRRRRLQQRWRTEHSAAQHGAETPKTGAEATLFARPQTLPRFRRGVGLHVCVPSRGVRGFCRPSAVPSTQRACTRSFLRGTPTSRTGNHYEKFFTTSTLETFFTD